MNLRASYRALRNNSISAMLAAIEIYNKPRIEYRDECFVILLVNAWELLLKAILASHKEQVYYPKKRGQAYRTLSLVDSLARVKVHFPFNIDHEPVAKNLELLVFYRDHAIHFYNRPGFGIVIYGLAQTSITNYRDLMLAMFDRDIADEMTIKLLPLAFGVQPDPVEYLRANQNKPLSNRIVAQYLDRITAITRDLESRNLDTARLLTVFKVSLQSVKKVTSADIIVGIRTGEEFDDETVVIERRIDPNQSHPLRRKEILQLVGTNVNGVRFTSFTFQAIVWHLGIKQRSHLCWQSANGELTAYAREVVTIIKNLSGLEIEEAVESFRVYRRGRGT